MPLFAIIITCVLAYIVVGIVVAALLECNGIPSLPGFTGPWETGDRGLTICLWPFVLAIHIFCFIMRGPAWISNGIVQGCKKRRRTAKEQYEYENSWRD